MLDSGKALMAPTRHALLVFANGAVHDCGHRGWPVALQQLLEIHNFPGWSDLGFDVHVFTSHGLVANATRGNLHDQHGNSFGEKLENAVETLHGLGYTQIVIVGNDCPDLLATDIQQAFSELQKHQLVLGPDHRGGCYLIGFNTEDRGRLRCIQWQRNTDFSELVERFGVRNCLRLSVKLDLDTWEDIRLLAESPSSWRHVAECLLFIFRPRSSPQSRTQLGTNEQSIRWQMPPPTLSRPSL